MVVGPSFSARPPSTTKLIPNWRTRPRANRTRLSTEAQTHSRWPWRSAFLDYFADNNIDVFGDGSIAVANGYMSPTTAIGTLSLIANLLSSMVTDVSRFSEKLRIHHGTNACGVIIQNRQAK